MFFYNLCSSSKGNCSFVGSQTGGILFDAGLSLKSFDRALAMADLSPECLRAIFITHEHGDHVMGLDPITRRFDIPIYGSRGTIDALLKKGCLSGGQDVHILEEPEEVAGFYVTPFRTPHDSAESIGFHVDAEDGHSIGVCTDLGFPSEDVLRGLLGCDFVMIESNYDRRMLLGGSYPAYLKQRIRSKNGHLSNDQCAQVIEQLIYNGTKQFVLAHLSEENNRPEIALAHSQNYLAGRTMLENRDYTIDVLPRFTEGKRYDLL